MLFILYLQILFRTGAITTIRHLLITEVTPSRHENESFSDAFIIQLTYNQSLSQYEPTAEAVLSEIRLVRLSSKKSNMKRFSVSMEPLIALIRRISCRKQSIIDLVIKILRTSDKQNA